MKLITNERLGYDEKEIVYLNWNEFEYLATAIAKDINNKCLDVNDVCLLGTARGALPLLTYVSHHTGIRNISLVHMQMTNSDNLHDYGDARILLEAIRTDCKYFIILEDIIYKGKTISAIEGILKNYSKIILEIYSLIVDEDFNIEKTNSKVKSSALLSKDKWVKFPWEDKSII